MKGGVVADDPIESDSDFADTPPVKKRVKQKPIYISSDDDNEQPTNTKKTQPLTKAQRKLPPKVQSKFPPKLAAKFKPSVKVSSKTAKQRRKAAVDAPEPTRDDSTTGEPQCSVCTFINPTSASRCEMCDNPLQRRVTRKRTRLQRRREVIKQPVSTLFKPKRKHEEPIVLLTDESGENDDAVLNADSPKAQPTKVAKSSRTLPKPSKVASSTHAVKRAVVSSTSNATGNLDINTSLWTTKYKPTNQTELYVALNKKRVNEITQWMQDPTKSMMVLHGPSGIGKTACVKALASQFGFSVREWSSETQRGTTTQYKQNKERKHDLNVGYVSQADDFSQFLKFSRYKPLTMSKAEKVGKSITLVKELPPFRTDDVKEQVRRCLIQAADTKGAKIIIVHTSISKQTNPNDLINLFTTKLLDRCVVLGLREVPPTRMKSILNKIAKAEGVGISTESILDCISLADGNLRCAIHSLQFNSINTTRQHDDNFFTKSTNQFSKSKSKKKSKNKTVYQNNKEAGKRDSPLSLNYAVGKLLRAKMENGKLNYCPESVAESCHLSPDALSLFIDFHANDYCSSIQHLYDIYESLSLSDTWSLSGAKKGKSAYTQKSNHVFPHSYVTSVAARCLPAYNSSPLSPGFVPITKPPYYTTQQNKKMVIHATRRIMQGRHNAAELRAWLPLLPNSCSQDDFALQALKFSVGLSSNVPKITFPAKKQSSEIDAEQKKELFNVLEDDDIDDS